MQEELPWRGNIIVENKANKEKAPELPVLISVTDVSSGANTRHIFRSNGRISKKRELSTKRLRD